jgi:Ca2+-dependent lipid-binding protein
VASKYAVRSFAAGGDGMLQEARAISDSFKSSGQVHAGIAFVKCLRGADLVNMDDATGLNLDKSDPYITLTNGTGRQTVKTKVVRNSLNPTWNEMLQLNVDDPSQPLRLRVWDRDRFSKDDPMGEAEVQLQGLEPMVPTRVTLPLQNVPRRGGGVVEVEVTWHQLDG